MHPLIVLPLIFHPVCITHTNTILKLTCKSVYQNSKQNPFERDKTTSYYLNELMTCSVRSDNLDKVVHKWVMANVTHNHVALYMNEVQRRSSVRLGRG